MIAVAELPCLRELTFGFFFISDSQAESIASAARRSGCQLDSLRLSDCRSLTPRGIRALLNTWPGLRKLQLKLCSELGLEGYCLAASMTSLTQLVFHGSWYEVSDDDLARQPLPAGLIHFQLGRKYSELMQSEWSPMLTGMGLLNVLPRCCGENCENAV